MYPNKHSVMRNTSNLIQYPFNLLKSKNDVLNVPFGIELVRSSSASQIIDRHRREFAFVDGQEMRISQALVRPLIDWWLMNCI